VHLDMHQGCDATPNRSGAGCSASSGSAGLASAECTVPAAGAPKGNRNALKHGNFTAEATAHKREIFAVARMARETLGAIK
jgi:hypothetical protein